MPDGRPVTYDGLPNTNFRVLFPKANNMIFFLQEFDLPSIGVKEVVRPTRFVDINEVGEKLIYQPFTCKFLVDKELYNFKEIYNWMKRMTVSGSNVGETDNAVLVINGKHQIRFNDCWPTSISGLQFITNATDVQYITATATWNYDYLEML